MRTFANLFLRALPLQLIHELAGPRLLLSVRRAFVAFWIFKLLLDPLWRLAEMPLIDFRPIGLLQAFPDALLNALLSVNGLTLFYCLLLTSLALCFWNRLFFLSSTLAAFLLTVYSSLIRGFGPAVHTDVIFLLSFYGLCGFAWSDFFTRNQKTAGNTCAYPLITIVTLLCLSYCMVGLNRLFHGGLQVFTGPTMEVWAIDAGLRGYYFNTGLGWHLPEWPWAVFFLKLGLPVTTFFEITAPLCLISRIFRWVFIPTMAVFHLLSLVLMNIFFFDNLLLYFLLIDWSRAFPQLSILPKLTIKPPPARSRGRGPKARRSSPASR